MACACAEQSEEASWVALIAERQPQGTLDRFLAREASKHQRLAADCRDIEFTTHTYFQRGGGIAFSLPVLQPFLLINRPAGSTR